MKHIIKVNNIQEAINNPIRPLIAMDNDGNLFGEGQAVVICHTQIANADYIDYYVEIQFEEGMTWSDFVNSSYNDESKMTGEEWCIGKFSIDGNDYVNAPFIGEGKGRYNVPQKGIDKIVPNIQYEVPTSGQYICYL